MTVYIVYILIFIAMELLSGDRLGLRIRHEIRFHKNTRTQKENKNEL